MVYGWGSGFRVGVSGYEVSGCSAIVGYRVQSVGKLWIGV